jgi:hypothetical protein
MSAETEYHSRFLSKVTLGQIGQIGQIGQTHKWQDREGFLSETNPEKKSNTQYGDIFQRLPGVLSFVRMLPNYETSEKTVLTCTIDNPKDFSRACAKLSASKGHRGPLIDTISDGSLPCLRCGTVLTCTIDNPKDFSRACAKLSASKGH